MIVLYLPSASCVIAYGGVYGALKPGWIGIWEWICFMGGTSSIEA